MVGNLLLRGMLVGLVAGLLTFAFLKTFGEPQVDRAIAFETQVDEQKAAAAIAEARAKGLPVPAEAPEMELVSRSTQAGLGLFTGTMVYGAAFGGLFALAFALTYGRLGDLGPRASAAMLAGLGLVAVYVVPNLKYPANPPAVGNPDTIGMRTGLYFAMVALSLLAMVAASMLRGRLVPSQGRWNASLWAGAAYLLAMVAVAALLPGIDEVPAGFSAVTLWSFRLASLGAQAILWTTLGLGFGAITQRVAERGGRGREGEGLGRLDAAVI